MLSKTYLYKVQNNFYNSKNDKAQKNVIKKTIEEIEFMVSDEYTEKLTDNERNVGMALLELLKNWEDIFTRLETRKFNKTSAYYFIKEYTMLSSKEVRDAMKKYKNLYFFTKQKLIED